MLYIDIPSQYSILDARHAHIVYHYGYVVFLLLNDM